MQKTDVIAYLKRRELDQTWLAKQLGISQPAVAKWPEKVPELQAIKISNLTAGELVYDEQQYLKKSA